MLIDGAVGDMVDSFGASRRNVRKYASAGGRDDAVCDRVPARGHNSTSSNQDPAELLMSPAAALAGLRTNLPYEELFFLTDGDVRGAREESRGTTAGVLCYQTVYAITSANPTYQAKTLDQVQGGLSGGLPAFAVSGFSHAELPRNPTY